MRFIIKVVSDEQTAPNSLFQSIVHIREDASVESHRLLRHASHACDMVFGQSGNCHHSLLVQVARYPQPQGISLVGFLEHGLPLSG